MAEVSRSALRVSSEPLRWSTASFSPVRHLIAGGWTKRRVPRRSLETSVEESLTRMRELVDLAGGASQGVDDASLMRFLRGFALNVDEAAKAFAKHQEWEASFKPNGFISEMEIPNELNAKKSYLQGRDKQGHPISVILARNHMHNKEDFDEFRRMK